MNLTQKNRENIEAARDEFRRMADALQDVLDGTSSLAALGAGVGISPRAANYQVVRQFRPYIRNRLVDANDLRAALETFRSPGDRLILACCDVDPSESDELILVPDHDEKALWAAVNAVLTTRERAVVAAVTGRDLGEPSSLRAVARSMNFTHEYVRYTWTRALRKICESGVIATVVPGASITSPDVGTEKAIARYRAAMAKCEAARDAVLGVAEELSRIVNESEPLAVDINDAGLSERTRRALHRHGVRNMSEIARLDASEIVGIRGVGAKGVREIGLAIERHCGVPRPDLTSPE